MTTLEFIKQLNEMGYKVNISHKNISKYKTKILISYKSAEHPHCWVFTDKQYSFRALGANEQLFKLMVEYASTDLDARGEWSNDRLQIRT